MSYHRYFYADDSGLGKIQVIYGNTTLTTQTYLGTNSYDFTVRPIPNSGKFFKNWTFANISGQEPYGNIADISADGTLFVPKTQSMHVHATAHFVNGVTLTLDYINGGDVIGTNLPADQTQTVAQGSSATFVVASAPTPPRGYRFSHWLIDGAACQPGDTVSISADTYASARYEPIPAHKVSFSADPTGIGFTPATITTDYTWREPAQGAGYVYYYDDSIDIEVQPIRRNGYQLESVTFFDSANPDVAIKTLTIQNGSLAPFVLSSSDRNGRDMLLRFNYSRISCTVTVAVHSASTGKVTVTANGNSSATVYWGETVTLAATVPTEAAFAGYSFAGWYDADGELVSDEASYPYFVQGDATLYAKCKVSCSMDIDYTSQEGDDTTTCSIAKDGEEYTQGTSFDIVLGDSFSYALTLGARTASEEWSLDRWTDGDGDTPLMYGQSGTVSPTAPLALVAHVASMSATSKTLTVKTGAVGSPLELTVPYNSSGEPVTPYTFEGNISPTTAHGPSLLVATIPTGEFANTFAGGVQYVRLTALPNVWFQDPDDSSVYVKQAFRGFYESASSAAPFSRDASCYLLMASDRTVWAAYGEAAPVPLNIEYADPDSANRGSVAIVSISDMGTGESIAADGRSAQVLQGHDATLKAAPKNGYEFAGWYDSTFTAGDAMSTDATFVLNVLAGATVYAKFVPARDRICAWEGSTENKTMEWTSKVYTMPRPFDPVAARVDATGYPVDLSVRTYSSPDKVDPLPVRDHDLTRQNQLPVQSQDGRRLPRMRPERYVQFSVETTHEVDTVAVGTNMAEVN